MKKPTHNKDEVLPHVGVVMYCTPWYPDCRRARTWLAENNIPYTEMDVSTNITAAQQVRAWANGNLITPTFDIDGIIIVDFDEERLSELLLD